MVFAYFLSGSVKDVIRAAAVISCEILSTQSFHIFQSTFQEHGSQVLHHFTVEVASAFSSAALCTTSAHSESQLSFEKLIAALQAGLQKLSAERAVGQSNSSAPEKNLTQQGDVFGEMSPLHYASATSSQSGVNSAALLLEFTRAATLDGGNSEYGCDGN